MKTTLNADKFGKLLALASSDNDNEALAALRMAKGLLTTAGLDFKDVAERMATPKTATSGFDFRAGWPATNRQPPKPKGYTKGGMTWESKAAYDADMARQRARFEQNRAKHADERAAIIAKYGSVDLAFARDEREQALHDAVARWLVPQAGCKPEGRWSESLDGWTDMQPIDKAPGRSVQAIKAALSLPSTISNAIAELNAWTARDHEIELALEDYAGNGGLDLPARLRCEVLRKMIVSELPATCIADAIARLEYAEQTAGGFAASAIAPTLADLRHLLAVSTLDTAKSNPAPVQTGQPATASARRAQVMAMLSNVDTAGWSDRAIAKVSGVSPTSVGKLRRSK